MKKLLAIAAVITAIVLVKRKKDQAESGFTLDFASLTNDAPSGTAHQLRNMPVKANQFESVFDVRTPFLRDEQKTKRCIRPHLLAQVSRNLYYGIFRILTHKNPRCCSRCHRT